VGQFESGGALSGLPAWADCVYSGLMPEVRKIARYTLEAILVLVPLVVVIYFLAYPDRFDAVLGWLVKR
jgi:hypothetical protein